MTRLIVYAFGSFFRVAQLPHDIDLLLLHEGISSESIQFSIQCKKLLKAQIENVHITMLSEQENRDLEFVSRSNAEQLGVISAEYMTEQIQQLAIRIASLNRRSVSMVQFSDDIVDKIDRLWPELGLPGSGKKIWD